MVHPLTQYEVRIKKSKAKILRTGYSLDKAIEWSMQYAANSKSATFADALEIAAARLIAGMLLGEPKMKRTHYNNGDQITLACGCDGCSPSRINGVLCHEQGCPEAWRDMPKECADCGGEFYSGNRFDVVCEDCQWSSVEDNRRGVSDGFYDEDTGAIEG